MSLAFSFASFSDAAPLFAGNGKGKATVSLKGTLLLFLCFGMLGGRFVSAVAQSVNFFGAFNSYNQSVVEFPQGIVADASGNLYISGTVNLSYIPVDSNGNPDSANQHQLDSCCGNAYGLAIDSANNLYRADIAAASYDGTPCGVAKYTYNSLNNFTKSCIGGGWVRPSSVAVDANFNVYVLEASTGTIYKLSPNGGSYTQSTLYGPDTALVHTTGMSIDSAGNLYIASGPSTGTSGDAQYAENPTPAVYKLTLSSGTYTRSFLGSGWVSPSSTTVDFEGNVWVSDYGANEVYVLIPSGSSYTQTAYTSINRLTSLVTNKAGQLYGLAAGSGDAVIWTGGSEPHTTAAASVGTASTPVPVTVSFSAPTDVTGYSVVTNGSTGQEFTDAGGGNCPAGSYSTGSTCSVNVSFTPQSPGLSTGALVLYGSGGAVLGTDYFFGVGQGPIVAFNPAVISTYAGTGNICNGTLTSCGDTGAAAAATLNNPKAVVFDASGDLYIADVADHAVRKVTPGGAITTIAGTGSQCVSTSDACGDGGAAVDATFTSPTGLALDGAGNLYIVDAGANRIRKVAAGTGVITTIAGAAGTSCSSPTAACGDGGAAASASFNMEGYGGAVVDPNANLIIADYGDNRLRSINLNTGIITTVAGTGAVCSASTATCGDGGQATSAQLNGPVGVGIDSSGDYFIADSNDNRVRKLSALTGVLTTVAGSGTACSTAPCGDGGAATSAQLNLPVMATTDPAGNVYIADSHDNAIRVVSSATGKISTVAGSYNVCDPSTATCGDTGAAPNALLDAPSGLALNASGNIFVAEATNRIREVNITETMPLNFPQTAPGATSAAISVEVTNVGNAALTFSGSPNLPNGFVEDSSTTCATSLAENATCTLAIDFAPPTASQYGGSAVLTDNNLNATTTLGTQQSILLNGTSQAPADTTSATLQVDPGMVVTSSPLTIVTTVTDTTNSGTIPTGSVTLTDTVGSTVTSLNGGNAVPLVSGVATLSGVTLDAAGQHTITASYAAITGFDASSSTGTVTVDPSLAVGTSTSSFPVTLTFTASGTLASIKVLTQGAPNLDFTDGVTGDTCTVGTTYSIGATCVVNAIFTPKYPGPRYGAVVLEDGSGNLLSSSYINGVGTGPQITFANNTTGVALPSSVTTPGGSFGFSSPSGMAVDAAGDIYVADKGHHAVEEIPAGCALSNCVATLGGSFHFNSPYGVAVDGAGNVFVADNGGHEVYEILAAGGYATVNSLGTSTSNSNPKGIAVDGAGNVYISGSSNGVYEIFAVSGYTTAIPLGGGFLNPSGVAVDGSGNVYVADTNNLAVKKMPAGCASSACVTQLASIGYPTALAIDGAGDAYVVSGALSKYFAYGGYSNRNTLAANSTGATSVAVAANGNVFATIANAVEEFDYADPPSLSYATPTPTGAEDTTDGTQTITSSNIGNAALTFSAVTYPANFSPPNGTSGACSTGAQLAAGSACSLPINFTPAETGSPLSESVVLVDNTLDGTSVIQLIPLSGTGILALTATTSVSTTTLTQNHAATTFTPVTGSGGTGTLSYSVSPALPAGLSFSTATGAISGTPTATSAATSYAATVTDANRATTTESFTLAVDSAVSATAGQGTTTLTESHTATTFTPVTGSGGTGTLTYSVSPALPAGLSFSTATGAVSGTATVSSSATSYTVTVTDANLATTTASFSLAVDSAVSATAGQGTTTLTENHTATTFTPVTGSGGTGTLTYSVSPALPAGLSFSTATGAISGTPTVTSAATSYTVTVTDANLATTTASFSLAVDSAVSATAGQATTTLTQNHAATTFTPVTGSGGTGTLSYSVSPALPAGLSFSTATGAISGTPTVTSAATSYTVTVTDANLATTTESFTLAVDSAVTSTTTVSAMPVTVYEPGTPFTPVAGSGGTAPLAYSVSPALPAGLSLSTTTGAISGTPTATSPATSYAVTVTDANGATVTANFSLVVNKHTSQTMVSAAQNAATPVQPVTLTATVAGTSTVPGGTVAFYDNGTQLGSVVSLVNGVATLSVPSLPAGAAAVITATYSGDGSFLSSTSSNSATVTIAPFDFTFIGTGASAYTAAPSAAATYSFALSPLYGSYAGPVSFAVAGLPAGATATFTPSSVAVGGGATPVVMKVQTAAAVAHNNSPMGRGIVLALLLLPFGMKRRIREKLKSPMLLMFLLLVGTTFAGTGCGSSNGFMLQSPQSYTLTVTATSGTLQHSQTVTLIVQ